MSDNKRANLITVDSSSKSKHKVSKTIRISLDLFEPNKKKFPEFNYKELVKDEETHRKEEIEKKSAGGQNGIRDSFSDNDEDVERIAKQFEQKYGSASTYGRRKGSCKQEDYADIGAGYDENDSFIDNTDGYDEMVPPECDTVLGGFYINSGSLEFKNVVGIGVDLDDASPTHRKTNKRPLSSSESEDESSSSDDDSETSTGEKRHSEEDQNNGKVTDSEKSGEDAKKKVKVKEHEDKETLPKKKRKSSQDTAPSLQTDQPSASHSATKKTVKELLAESRATGGVSENNVDGSTDSHSSDSSCKAPAAVPSSDNPVSSDSSRDAPVPPTSSPPPPPQAPIPPLPPNLPPEAAVLAKRLKALAEAHFASHTGKLSGPEVNEIILGMEKHCRKGGVQPSTRHALFSHAAALLRRGKPGLIQRARRLADENQRINSSKTTIDKLKNIVDKMKPALLQNYKTESDRILETNKNIALQNSTAEDDKKIPEKRLPKRRFPWNDQVRSLISDLLKEQNIPEEDEPMSRFLHTVVFPLFPSGFVRMPTLLQQAKLSKNIKPLNDKSKNVSNKSFEKQHSTSNNVNKQSANVRTSPEAKMNLQSERGISDPETMLPVQQRSNKLHTSSICIGTDMKDNELKLSEPIYRNDHSPNHYVNNNDVDKNKTYRIPSDMSPKLGDNISISVTNVFQKTNEGEKLSPSPPKTDKYHHTTGSSLTITPVSNPHKESRSYQSQMNSDVGNSLTIIPKPSVNKPGDIMSPNVSPPNQTNSLKVKSSNALFDKSTIAKIISGKNTHGDGGYKPDSRDNYRSRSHSDHHRSEKSSVLNHMHSNVDVMSKPNTLPESPLPMLSKTYLGTSEPRIEDLKPSYNSNNEMFVKPKYKTDNSSHYHRSSSGSIHLSPGGYHKSPDQKSGENNKYQRESSKSPHDKSYESINLSPAHKTHTESASLNSTSPHNSTSVLKQHRIHKKYEGGRVPVPSGSPNSSRHFNFSNTSYKSSKSDVMSVDDSSSDDCVEIVGEDGYTHKRSRTSVYREEEARRSESSRRELEKHYASSNVNQTSGHSKSDFSIKSIVDDKPYSVKSILKSHHPDQDKIQSPESHSHSVIHNQPDKSIVKYPNIKRQAILENEAAESKKYKHSDVVDMKSDKITKYAEDRNNHNYTPTGNSSVKCEPVSVIKDNCVSKSESRYTDHVYEHKPSDEGDCDKYSALDLELNRVMQDLKELQDLQKCPQDEPHQRLYDDSTNKVYRTNHFTPDGKSIYNSKGQQDGIGTVLKNQLSFVETTSSHNVTTGPHH